MVCLPVPISTENLPSLRPKNELTDFLSRELVEKVVGCPFDDLAKSAFSRMDAQLEFCLDTIFTVSAQTKFSAQDYIDSELFEIWEALKPHVAKTIDDYRYYRTDSTLFRETKILIPMEKLSETLLQTHDASNHPGITRTVLSFLQHFATELSQKELFLTTKPLVDNCETCLLNKPNRQIDRGEIGSLPIPFLANDILYIDFVHMDNFNGHDYCLTVVDASHCVQFSHARRTSLEKASSRSFLRDGFLSLENPTPSTQTTMCAFPGKGLLSECAKSYEDFSPFFYSPTDPSLTVYVKM